MELGKDANFDFKTNVQMANYLKQNREKIKQKQKQKERILSYKDR